MITLGWGIVGIVIIATSLALGHLLPSTTSTRSQHSPTPSSSPLRYSVSASDPSPYQNLAFYDEFDKLDNSVWEHQITAGGGGNWEFQFYTNNRSNSYVKDGILYIKPTMTSDRYDLQRDTLELWGNTPASLCTGNQFYGCMRIGGAGGNIINPIQSASLRSTRSFSFRYGRLEVRAKLPIGDWIWPAIWLLPMYDQYGGWPSSGEIDLMESRGNRHYPNGVDAFMSTLHWGPAWNNDPWPLTHKTLTLPAGQTFGDDFHVYGMEWNDQGIFTYLDRRDQVVLNVTFDRPFWQRGGWEGSGLANPWENTTNATPFDQEFYIIMNVAVGGINYFKDGVGGKPWNDKDQRASTAFWNARNQWQPTWTSPAMQIDWVRVYQ